MNKILIATFLAICVTGFCMSSVSAYDRIPFKFNNAESWYYNNHISTNCFTFDQGHACGKDSSGYMVWDMNKPIDTLDISYTCSGTGGSFVGFIFNIPSPEKLLKIDRFDMKCNHDTNGYDKMDVTITFDDKTQEKFIVDDSKEYDTIMGNMHLKHATI